MPLGLPEGGNLVRWCCWLAAVTLIGLGPLGRLAAQTPAGPAAPPAADPPKSASTQAIEASPLDTIYLRDAKGNLVPVAGMSFEEFRQLLEFKKGLLPPAAPAYSLDALTLVGSADGGAATLQVTATIRVRQEGWVRIPLLLPTAVVRGEPKHEGPGEHFLQFDAAAGGYVCWLKGAGDQPHVLTIPAAANVTAAGEHQRLALTLPRATESSLRLNVPLASIEAALTGDGLATTRPLEGGQSEISVLGPAGEVQLSWRKGRTMAAKGPPQFDASGEIQVRVDSQRSITSTAQLRVQAASGLIDAFQVRLPPGMELESINRVGYTLTPLTPPSSERRPKADQGQLVEVRLDKPAAGVTTVQISAALEAGVNPPASLTPARFEVLGAVRQRGTIEFVVPGQWQLEWTEDRSVRRLDISADAAPAGTVARFEYFRQPCGLQLKVSARPSRISVEPTHVVSVDAQQLRIKSTFKYKFRGSRAAGLSFELGDWKFLSLMPGDLLETPVQKGDAAGRVEVAFRPEAAPAELELTLEAHQTLPPSAANIQFTLPLVQADVIAPATLVISPADNIELSPQAARIASLSPDPSGVRIPGRQQPPLVYRDLGGGEPALFAAQLQVRSRTSLVDAKATVRLDKQQLQVEQRLDFRIAHEPQKTFTLLAPLGLVSGGNLKVLSEGVPLVISPLPESPSPGGTAAQKLQVSTAVDQIGSCQLSVRYALPLPAWEGDQPLSIALPLVIPADPGEQTFGGQQVDFVLPDGWQVEPEQVGEFSLPTPLPAAAPPMAFSWGKATLNSRWSVQREGASQQSAIVVSKAWIQTWLAPKVRQERVAYRFITAQDSLRVQLPSGTLAGEVQAALNSQETPKLRVRENRTLRIDLPPAMRGRECTLELWYALESPEPWLGLEFTQLQAASIDGASPPRRTFWQLALPANEHLLGGPGELISEMVWSRDGWLPLRKPVHDQRELEDWVHASRQDPLPRGMQIYLFGGLGRKAMLAARTINRRLLLALASGGALAVGLALLHWPALRRPAALLVLAVVLAAAALAAPELALLAGQGAILGLLVLFGAAAWNWQVFGAAAWPAPAPSALLARGGDSRRLTAISTQPPQLRVEPGSQPSSTSPREPAAVEAPL